MIDFIMIFLTWIVIGNLSAFARCYLLDKDFTILDSFVGSLFGYINFLFLILVVATGVILGLSEAKFWKKPLIKVKK